MTSKPERQRAEPYRRGLVPAIGVLIGTLLGVPSDTTNAAAPEAVSTDFTLGALSLLLHRETSATADFHELQYRRVLKTPLERSGELHFEPPATFEKRVRLPVSETYRIEGETLSMSLPDRATRQISLRNQPLLGGLLLSFKAVIGGQLDSLGTSFTATVGGTPDAWTLDLRPTQADVARYVDAIRVSGRRSDPLRFEVIERSGDRTVTDIVPR
jgi:Outer membrane lipoprotein carrier protein LolA-like